MHPLLSLVLPACEGTASLWEVRLDAHAGANFMIACSSWELMFLVCDLTSWNALLGARSADWHNTNLPTALLPLFLKCNVSLKMTMCFAALICEEEAAYIPV